MARSKSPAYQRYPRDILANPDIMALTFEEYGVYERFRDIIWLEEYLPNDEIYLAKIFKISPKKFRRLFSAIKKLFQIDNEKIRCPELDEERQKQAEWRLKSSEGGRKSVESRRNRVKGGSDMVQRVVEPDVNSSTSISTSTSHTPYPSLNKNQNGNGCKEENPVCVDIGSKFSEEERRKYADSQFGIKNPAGWLIKSESGCFDKQIEKWLKNPRTAVGFNGAWEVKTVCDDCQRHKDYPDDIKPCWRHDPAKRTIWCEEKRKLREAKKQEEENATRT